MTNPAFDAVGAGQIYPGSNNVSTSLTGAAGADVFIDVCVDRQITLPTFTYNGVTFTLVDSQECGNVNNAAIGFVYTLRAAAAADGSAHNVTATMPVSWWIVVPYSITNVGAITTQKAFGVSTAPSSGSVTLTTGQLAVCAIASSNDTVVSTMSSPSGGTAAYAPGTVGPNGNQMAIRYSSTTGTTFAATLSASTDWATLTLIVSPPANTVTMGGATAEVVTGGTISDTAPAAVTPGAATAEVVTGATISDTVGPAGLLLGNANPLVVSGGTIGVTAPANVALAAAAAELVSGGVISAVVASTNPMVPSLTKLANNQNSIWQIIGDSTAWGLFDPFQSTLFGWVGRMAIACGEYYNVNVVVYLWKYPSLNAYNAPVTAYSAVGGGRATLTVYLGGWPGGVEQNYLINIATMMPSTSADVLIHNSGFNEDTPLTGAGSYTSYLSTFLSEAQSTYCPSAPIIVTTENANTPGGEGSHHVTFAQIFGAMLGVLLPAQTTLPLSPAVQLSTTVSALTIIDTQQAGQTPVDLYADGLHPIASGYEKQAAYMLLAFAPQVFAYVLGASAPTQVVSGGTLGVTAPANVALGSATTELVTGGTLSDTAPASVAIGNATPEVVSAGTVSDNVAPAVQIQLGSATTEHITGDQISVGPTDTTAEIVIVPPSRSAVVWR